MNAVVAELSGGMGNQLFQYAYAYGVAKRTGRRLVLDDSKIPTYPGVPRKFELGAFGLEAEAFDGDAQQTYLVIAPEGYEAVTMGHGPVERIRGLWMGEGPWAEFAEDIRTALPMWKEEISAIAVHVRRKDFLGPLSPMINLGVEYYERALAGMGNHEILVFSDDPDWCRNSLKLGHVLDEQDPHSAFQWMCACRHHVIANSSFSWWAAWLAERPGQIVVAPSQWLRNNVAVTKQIVPNRWTTWQ
jgi:hypothetical protein